MFRLTLTPFWWVVTSAQRTHGAQFFVHGCWITWQSHALLMSQVGVENYGDLPVVHYEHKSRGCSFLHPAAVGSVPLMASGGLAVLPCFTEGGSVGLHISSFCVLLWEALFPVKGRLIFLWSMLQLFVTFLQQQEICWAWEESGGWPLAVVFLYF